VDPSTRQLRSFVVLAEELSFTRAADRLHVAQQALSSQISRLEQALGLVLFERSTRRVSLTPAGARLLEGARTALTMLDDAVRTARAEGWGSTAPLKVGFLETAALELTAPIVAAFRLRRPEITLELVGTDYTDPTCGLPAGRCDVALVRLPLGAPGISTETVFTEALTLCVPASHPLATRSSITLAEAVEQPLIAPSTEDPVWRNFWTLDAYRPAATHPAPVVHLYAYVSSSASEFPAVALGSGCTLATTSTYRFVSSPFVRFVPIEGAPRSEVAVAWMTGNEDSRVHDFRKAAADARREHPEILESIERPEGLWPRP
jgi:DNA-binding transcriptional LysR family regulator